MLSQNKDSINTYADDFLVIAHPTRIESWNQLASECWLPSEDLKSVTVQVKTPFTARKEEQLGEGRTCLKSKLSANCLKGHSSVTQPLNIPLNDQPCLLTRTDKAKKRHTVSRPPSHPHLFFFIFSCFLTSHSLSPSPLLYLDLRRVRFWIIKWRIPPRENSSAFLEAVCTAKRYAFCLEMNKRL